MDTIKLEALSRETGKGAARAARRQGNVPCVLYGHHVEPVVFQVPEPALHPLIYTHETHVVNVTLDGDAWDCIVKDIAFHPVTDRPLHADFQVLQAGELVTMTVPVSYMGTPAGHAEGGVTNTILNELEVRCLPKDIPGHIDVDISGLNIGDALHVSDLEVEGVEFIAAPGQTLVTVMAPRVLVEEEEPSVLDLEGGEEALDVEDEDVEAEDEE